MAKMRSRFVANSSSSSFIVIGEQPTWSLQEAILKMNHGDVWVAGQTLGDGTDIFLLNPELAKYIKRCDYSFGFYPGFAIENEDGSADKNALAERIQAIKSDNVFVNRFWKDWCSTCSPEDLKEKYKILKPTKSKKAKNTEKIK